MNMHDFSNLFKLYGVNTAADNISELVTNQIQNKNEKLLYLLYQTLDMLKSLTQDHKIINYNISPINLIINDHWRLKLMDFSTVDILDDELPEEESKEMRSQFKKEIKQMAMNQKQQSNAIHDDLADTFSHQSRVVQIKTTQDYFTQVKTINPEYFVLKKIVTCFEEFFNKQAPQKGLLKQHAKELQMMKQEKENNYVIKYIDLMSKQIEQTKSLDIVLNSIEAYICHEMPKDNFEQFINLFMHAEKSSLTTQGRLKMAQCIHKIAKKQNNERLQALCLLTIGQINKSLFHLEEAL